ncbi:putative LOC729966 homolog [Lycodopsis pacificus]
MPAAMHLTVLVSLFAVAVSEGTTYIKAKQVTEITTSAAHHTGLAAKNNNVSSSPLPSSSPQTPNRTEETHLSVTSPQITRTKQSSKETVSHESTLPSASESPTITATTIVNITSTGLPEEWDVTTDPALVAIICIFSFAFVALLLYTIMKCRSSENNFERLEDVPMSNVNEASPFAKHSK